jgi:ribosomal protein S12 methylthiotransferase accessory factor
MKKKDPETERLMELVSPRVGLIRSVSRMVRGEEEPSPPYIYNAVLAHFDYRKGESERYAAGKGMTEFEALRAAIGEAVEHYCASHYDARRSSIAPWEAVGAGGVTPDECVLYSASQYARSGFRYRRWNPSDAVTWTPMRELPEGRDVWAPAALVYLVQPGQRPEDFFCFSTSNGLAAGPTVEFATLNGLYELIERDGFLITWMNKLPAPEVDFSGTDGPARRIREHYARFGSDVRVFNMSTDIPVYSMMALALDRTGTGPGVVVGLGCHLDPQVAVLKALYEICQTHFGETRRFREKPPAARYKSYEDVQTLEDHSAFLSDPARLHEFSFLLENGRTQRVEQLPNRSRGGVDADLETVVGDLRAAGCRVLYAELTTPDVLPYGFRVVRTIATGLQPMHFGFGEERLGGRRLFEVPHRLGHADAPRTESDLNPCPHPLA